MNVKVIGFLGITILSSSVGMCQTAAPPAAPPVQREERKTGIEILARFKDQPTEVARTPAGRIFCVLYNSITDKSQLVEVKKDGTVAPYPNAQWNAGRNADKTGFSEIVALKTGANGWLGVVDAGSSTFSPRVVVFDTNNNTVVREKELPIKRPPGAQRFKQDLAIDVPHKCIYLIGTSNDRKSATVIVNDFNTDSVRSFTVLKGKVEGEPSPANATTEKDTASLRWGMSVPIAIDPGSEWVYMGGIGGDELFRVPTAVLADPALTTDDLLRQVEYYGNKAICTHIAADAVGNVYCTEDDKIGIFSPDRKYRTFLQDAILNYPFGLAAASDGYLYITVNQLRRLTEKGNTTVDANHPFMVVRARMLQAAP